MVSVVQRYKRKKIANKVDWISKLPDDVLLLILSRLTTKEAIRTSVVSKRWEHVWKQMPHLVLNTRRNINLHLSNDSNPDAALTRVINNHYGHLESCEITHFSNQGVHGLLKTWIQTVQTRNLTLANSNLPYSKRGLLKTWIQKVQTRNLTLANSNLPYSWTFRDCSPCSFPLCSFAHPKLMSLSLKSYKLVNSIPFRNCSNIKILKLLSISSPNVEVFNNILVSCPSLEVLVLNNFNCSHTMGRKSCLEIKNRKLKFLEIFSIEIYSIKGIDKVIVSAPNLDILVVKDTYAPRYEFLLQSPNLQFNGTGGNGWLHIIYNISMEKNSGHGELVNRIGELTGEDCPTLSVAVDLMNETEVERLRQVLCLWSNTVYHIEIKFKANNSPSPSEEEIECWQKKLWVDEDFFPNAKFRVDFFSIYNFRGSKEEIAFVSCLIRQGKVRRKIRIYSKSFSTSNRSNIEAAVAKLQEVQSEDQQKVPEIELIRNG